MTNAYSVFARTKPKNIVDRANYDTVVNLLKRSTLSSVLTIKNHLIPAMLNFPEKQR